MEDLGPPSLFESARLRIAHLKLDDSDDLWRAATSAARVSATTLAVARVGIWSLSPDRARLHRVVVHCEGVPVPPDGMVLPLLQWPAYLEAVLSRRVVAADDARTDPRTRELRDAYLEPLGIVSMLDVPLFLGGQVWGVVCHEHVGAPRVWSRREIDFAVSVADMLSALLEQSLRVKTETRLRLEEHSAERARHAEALARTAAGIGHDVNTVLQAIASSAEQARQQTDEQARHDAVDAILENCRRGARVIDQLKDLDAPRELIGSPIDLAVLLAELRTTMASLLEPKHVLAMDIAPHALVLATRTDIERIVLNLVINARDAMPEGGTVTLRVAVAERMVTMTLQDEGIGIHEGDQELVFEPYFTTKGGRHTGLGLFAVQTIGARTGGAVTLTSEPGRGTSISVRWPIVDDA